MTHAEAYQALDHAHVHWDRKDSNHIVVWTSGYKCAEHYDLETFLIQAGFRMISEEFDPMCGKTRAIYRHK